MQALSLFGEPNDGVVESFGKVPESLRKGRERDSPAAAEAIVAGAQWERLPQRFSCNITATRGS